MKNPISLLGLLLLAAPLAAQISDEAIVRKDGAIVRMTQREALAHCKAHGGRLASTRDFARYMNPGAIVEVDEIHGKVPEGYYLVACEDDAGKVDTFYFNNEAGRNGEKPRVLTGELAQHSFWTSSLVRGKTDYAHVFYGPLGGGGGTPEDHHRDVRHAVVMIEE